MTMTTRLDRIDNRLALLDERMSGVLSLVIRVAERLDGGRTPPPAPQ
jgi:hypothetical protein